MVKNLPEIQWKSINVDDPDLACDGLIAFEECSNYTLFGKNNEEPSSKVTLEFWVYRIYISTTNVLGS